MSNPINTTVIVKGKGTIDNMSYTPDYVSWNNIICDYNRYLGYEKFVNTRCKVRGHNEHPYDDNHAVRIHKTRGFRSITLRLKGVPESATRLLAFIQDRYAEELAYCTKLEINVVDDTDKGESK
jgi:hypothetical protein